MYRRVGAPIVRPSQTFQGTTRVVEVEPCDSIAKVKLKVRENDGLVLGEQRLSFAGKQLEDKSTVLDCGIDVHATLELSIPLRGGSSGAAASHKGNVDTWPLNQLLSATDQTHSGNVLLVPSFQRPYVWTSAQATRLLAGILDGVDAMESSERMAAFLSTIVLVERPDLGSCSPPSSRANEFSPEALDAEVFGAAENVFMLVDGRQRLTTLMLIAFAIWDEARALAVDAHDRLSATLSFDEKPMMTDWAEIPLRTVEKLLFVKTNGGGMGRLRLHTEFSSKADVKGERDWFVRLARDFGRGVLMRDRIDQLATRPEYGPIATRCQENFHAIRRAFQVKMAGWVEVFCQTHFAESSPAKLKMLRDRNFERPEEFICKVEQLTKVVDAFAKRVQLVVFQHADFRKAHQLFTVLNRFPGTPLLDVDLLSGYIGPGQGGDDARSRWDRLCTDANPRSNIKAWVKDVFPFAKSRHISQSQILALLESLLSGVTVGSMRSQVHAASHFQEELERCGGASGNESPGVG